MCLLGVCVLGVFTHVVTCRCQSLTSEGLPQSSLPCSFWDSVSFNLELTGEHLGSSCLSPRAGVHVQLLHGCWGSNCRSSCLCSKNWTFGVPAITPADTVLNLPGCDSSVRNVSLEAESAWYPRLTSNLNLILLSQLPGCQHYRQVYTFTCSLSCLRESDQGCHTLNSAGVFLSDSCKEC